MAIYSMGRRRVIVLLILTSILLITLDQRGNAVIDRLRSGFSLVLEPFDTAGAHDLAAGRQRVERHHRTTTTCKRENEALRDQIDEPARRRGRGAGGDPRVPGAAAAEPAARHQQLPDGRRLGVSGRRPSNFQYTVEIDKGSNDGIARRHAGRERRRAGRHDHPGVPRTESIVLLITDPEFAIGAKVLTESSRRRADTLPTTADPEPSSTSITTTTTTTDDHDAARRHDHARPTPTSIRLAPVPSRRRRPRHARRRHPATTTTPTVEVVRETGTLQGQGADQPLVLARRAVDDGEHARRFHRADRRRRRRRIAPRRHPDRHDLGGHGRRVARSSPVVEVEPSAGDLTKLNFVRVLLYVPNLSGG